LTAPQSSSALGALLLPSHSSLSQSATRHRDLLARQAATPTLLGVKSVARKALRSTQ